MKLKLEFENAIVSSMHITLMLTLPVLDSFLLHVRSLSLFCVYFCLSFFFTKCHVC